MRPETRDSEHRDIMDIDGDENIKVLVTSFNLMRPYSRDLGAQILYHRIHRPSMRHSYYIIELKIRGRSEKKFTYVVKNRDKFTFKIFKKKGCEYIVEDLQATYVCKGLVGLKSLFQDLISGLI